MRNNSSNFVKQLIGDRPIRKVETVDKYLAKNEIWQEAVARVLLTGILKNQFYRSTDDAAKEALPLFISAAKKDPMFLLKAAAFARNSHMKGMVKVALAAVNGQASEDFLTREIVRKGAIGILKTFHPGQLIQFVELCKSKAFGRGFGSRPQKWVRSAMETWHPNKLEMYTLKYPQALNQLVRLVHPRYNTKHYSMSKGYDVRGGIVKYVLDGKKEPVGRRQAVVEELKRLPKEAGAQKIIATAMIDHDIPWDVIKGFAGMSGPIAIACLSQMNLTSLLRNLQSLNRFGVFNNPRAVEALKMKMQEVQNGRSIPLDFAKPYIHCTDAGVKEVLLQAMADTLDVPMPAIENKRVGVSIDISGSMSGEPLKTAGLLAVPFLKAKKLWFTTFDTSLYEEGTSRSACYYSPYHSNRGKTTLCPKLKGQRRIDQVKNLLDLRTNGGTNVAISLEQAIRNKRKLDVHVLITDEQQNSGESPLRSVWQRYKAKVNPNAQLWVINATNYEWHSADLGDPSVVIYQSMTPAIFHNLEYAGENLTKAISEFRLDG